MAAMRSPCSPLFYLFIVTFLNSTSITHDEERCKVGLQTLETKLFASPYHAMGFIKERLSDLAGYLKPHERQMATSDPDAVLPNGQNMDRHHY